MGKLKSNVLTEKGWSDSPKTVKLCEVSPGSYFMHRSSYDTDEAPDSHIFRISKDGERFSPLSNQHTVWYVVDEADAEVHLLDLSILYTSAK